MSLEVGQYAEFGQFEVEFGELVLIESWEIPVQFLTTVLGNFHCVDN